MSKSGRFLSVRALGLALILALAGLGVSMPAGAAPNHTKIVSAVPAATTPGINNGETDAIVQVGNQVIAGGTFTTVTAPSGTAQTRNFLFAFNASTGQISSTFVPVLNGSVMDVVAGPTADTVYVGGTFTQVNGVAASHLTLLNVNTGLVSGSFRAASTNGVVNTLISRSNRLYVGGNFTTAGGVAHGGLASMNPTTGALDPFVKNQVTLHHNDTGSGAQGSVGVRDIDVNVAGTRMVAIGNFKKVDGIARDQAVVISLNGPSSAVTADWNTNRYQPYCFNFAFDTYMRGVSFSPDGSYFVITATGGQNAGTLCDTAARFETGASGSAIQPTWVDYTGGDTLWSVAVTEKAVYVGGHQRWLNNSLASDTAGPGAVPRPGLAALNTRTGLPVTWNPGRNPRGAAVYALYPTSTGLWMGSDTEYVGAHFAYKRPRIAFFPLATGTAEAADTTAGIPGTAYLGGPAPGDNTLKSVKLTSTGASAAATQPNGGVEWSRVRGSFEAGGKLWYGFDDGSFYSRTVRGSTFGAATRIDPYNDPVWDGIETGSGNTYDGKAPNLYSQITSVTGMAYSAGKLYYTLSGSSNLFWRWFNTDSGIIGTDLFTANAGRSWNGTEGMFAASGELYFVTTSTRNLNAITLAAGGPTGSATVVNGPATGGNDWRGRALFLGPAT